jgi:hypothetical protein
MLSMMTIMPRANTAASAGADGPEAVSVAPDPESGREMPTWAAINRTTPSRAARITSLPGT